MLDSYFVRRMKVLLLFFFQGNYFFNERIFYFFFQRMDLPKIWRNEKNFKRVKKNKW